MKSTIDQRLLMDLAEQLGFEADPITATTSPPNNTQTLDPKRQALAMAESMKGKSDSEILSEIMKLKSTLQKNPSAYEKQIRAVKSLRGMMNPEQRKRLDQVLDLLEH